MNQTEIIDPGLSKDVPQDAKVLSKAKDIPLSVTSGTQYTIMHGLGVLPRSIFVAMADNYVSVKVIWRNPTHALIAFNATANLILRVQ